MQTIKNIISSFIKKHYYYFLIKLDIIFIVVN
jgi:hypothetical protein